MDLNGKTALLTGATGGLGRAIAASLAGRGARLVLTSRKAEELERLAGDLPGEGHVPLVADLAEDGVTERVLEQAGEVDILVANAGLPGTGRIEQVGPEQVSRVLRVNLESPMRMASALIGPMRERGHGHLVFISSVSGKIPSPRSSIYNATKFGLRGFSHALRADLAGSGVSSSVVLPGFIRDAGMFADGGGEAPKPLTSAPDEVGAAVVRAIERDRPEITVAPLPMRAVAAFAVRHPTAAARVQRGRGERMVDDLAAGQAKAGKR